MFIEELRKIEKLHLEIAGIHRALGKLSPVAVVTPAENRITIYDVNPSGHYECVAEKTASFPLPDRIEAAFPLEFYDPSKSCCIVSENVFEDKNSFVTVFHEFVHCYQFATCELKIKSSLLIAKKYPDSMWEINHPFPYTEAFFVNAFGEVKNAVEYSYSARLVEVFRSMKSRLQQTDYEYLIWQMWKEGLARYVENCIREKYGLDKNTCGSQLPYDRISMYYLGELLISYLRKKNEAVVEDIEALYRAFYEFQYL